MGGSLTAARPLAMPNARAVPGRVSPVNRRLTLLSGALLATLALSSCGAATGDDVVARVNGHELTNGELSTLAEDSDLGADLRSALAFWIRVVSVLDDPTGMGVNPGGFTLHSAVHMARHDLQCVMHTHTAATIAVGVMERGLLPLTQHAMRFTDRIAYHSYEGIYFTDEERKRVQVALATKKVALLRNHGTLVCGRDIPEAFDLMYHLERACQAQVSLLSTGEKLVYPQDGVAQQVASVYEAPSRKGGAKIWPAMLRMLDRIDPSYRQ